MQACGDYVGSEMKTEESRVERSGLIESRENNCDAPCQEQYTIVIVRTLKRRSVSRTATSSRVNARGTRRSRRVAKNYSLCDIATTRYPLEEEVQRRDCAAVKRQLNFRVERRLRSRTRCYVSSCTRRGDFGFSHSDGEIRGKAI